MIWIFPMAGKGSRTRELGEFKPFIEINGRKMLGWLFRSIGNKIKAADKLIFITTEEYALAFDVLEEIREICKVENLPNQFELVTTPQTPPGPSATVYCAKEHLLTDQPVIVVNCDQYIDFDVYSPLNDKTGFLPVYAQFGQKSSYVDIKEGIITRIVEKQNISNLASAGVYAVSDGRALVRAIEEQFKNKQMTNNEFYVGVALNNLIDEGYKFYPTSVRVKYDLGNVNGIESFSNNLLKTQIPLTYEQKN